jgi:hypothetical protein
MANAEPRNPRRRGRRRLPGVVALALCLAVLLAPPTSAAPALRPGVGTRCWTGT